MKSKTRNAYHIVIPARFTSERLPGKLLLPLAGRPVIQHVWQCAIASSAESVVIATDDERIAKVVRAFGAQAVLTSTEHRSGSDRIAECADILGWPDERLIVNLQGDEPLMPTSCLDQVADLLVESPDCDVASLYWPISDATEAQNPNAVKVVTAIDGRALYFSRSAIPYERSLAEIQTAIDTGRQWKRHLGLYAYRFSALRRYTAMPPTPLELCEKLEQLRLLEQGGRIVMAQANKFIPAGVDTAEDLERVLKLI